MSAESAADVVGWQMESGNVWPSPADIIEAHSKGRHLFIGEIDRFVQRGVPKEALFSPHPILAAEVVFLANGYFEFSTDCFDGTPEYAFIMLVEADGGAIDIAAWQPKTGRIGLWLKRAFALGEEQIWPRFEGDPLHIWRTPMKWLKASRQGVVIVRREAAFYALGNLPDIIAEDVEHGDDLEALLTPPKSRTRIMVPAITKLLEITHCEAA